jgi:hypothetical protein
LQILIQTNYFCKEKLEFFYYLIGVMKRAPRRFIVDKQATETTTTNYDTNMTMTSYEEDDTTDTQSGAGAGFTSIVNSSYKKPRDGTKQDNMSSEDIKKKLEGFVPLRTMQEKRVITTLPLFKTWVRYINKDTKQFRTGGLLMKVSYPDYIMLVNTNKTLTWSVQIRDNVLFVRDPKDAERIKHQKSVDNSIKDRLFDMYKRGELTKK